MKTQNRISELLHSTFSSAAIEAGAICEQLEDVKYCSDHNMNHLNGGTERTKWESLQKKAEQLVTSDKTFTVENMQKFQNAVNDLKQKNPEIRLFEGLSETEHYAARRFYYYNCH